MVQYFKFISMDIKMKKKILFSAGNGPNSIQIIKNFKNLSFEVYVADIDIDCPGKIFADYFFHLPFINDEKMIPVLKNIIVKYKIDFFVPARENECLITSYLRDEFKDIGCTLVTPNTKTLKTSINKAFLYDFLSNNTNIPMMRYHIVNSKNDLEEGFNRLSDLKLSIKPAIGAGSRGFAIIDDTHMDAKSFFSSKNQFITLSKENLLQMFDNSQDTPTTLLMEMLEGIHYDATALCKDGEIICQFVKTREEAKIGTITKGEVIEHNEIKQINKEIVKKLNTTGLIATQFIGNKIIEINPRWSTSLVTNHINEYLLDLQVWAGEEIDLSKFNKTKYLNTRMSRYWDLKVYKDVDYNVIKCDENGIIS